MAIVTASAPETTKVLNAKPQTLLVPTPEPKVDEVLAVPEEKKLSPQYAQLAKREKDIRLKQEALKSEIAAFKASQEEFTKTHIPKDRFKKDPLAVALEAGLTQDELINIILNGQPKIDPALSEVQQKLSAIEKAQLEASEKSKKDQEAAYERAVSEIRSQAEALVASNADYETIKETGLTEAIVELIKQTYDTKGKLLSVEEAAKQVEEHLFEDAMKMATLTKVKAKLASPPPEAEQVEDPNKKPSLAEAKAKAPQQQIKTLTNAATAAPSKPLSNKDRRTRAILAFKGELS